MVNFDSELDYYEILQVHPSAHQEVIKRAYRTIVGLLQAHPDLGGSHEDAVRVNEAYQVLSDPDTRKAYDEARARKAAMTQRAEATRAAQAHSAAHRRAAGNRQPATGAAGLRAYPSAGHPTQTVFCPHCGARNRLPQAAKRHLAICGKCHAPLLSMRRRPAEPTLPSGDMPLPADLIGRLIGRGEILLKRAQLPEDGRLVCLRCHYEWVVNAHDKLPAYCPHCRDPKWSDFRLFRCRHCAHQFTTDNLLARPYRLYAACPSCHKRYWHAGCERHPLIWLLRRLNQRGT